MGNPIPPRIAIVYLGRKGGGARLAFDLARAWENIDINFASYIAAKSEFISTTPGQLVPIPMPSTRFNIFFSFFLKRRSILQIGKEIAKYMPDLTVFVMPHPWNPVLMRFLRSKELRTAAIIHDHRSHLGEIWPSTFHIKSEIRSADSLIFLSQFVSNNVRSNKNRLIFQLESLPLSGIPRTQTRTILVPGRIRKYKGLGRLVKLLEVLPIGFVFKVVGQGKLPKQIRNSKEIIFENSWLSAFDFDREIANAELILLPNVEATQSGIIALAKAYEKQVIATNVGGVSEQLLNYQNGLLAENNIESLSLALKRFANNELQGSQILENAEEKSYPSIFDLPQFFYNFSK